MPFLRYAQLRYLSIILAVWLAIFTLTRTLLLVTHWGDAGASLADLLWLYVVGLIYDLSFLSYAALPMALYLFLCPGRLWRRPGHRWWLLTLAALSLFVMLFTAVAEWLFWDEFDVRFNFIAVDYLVYSKEVIDNIRQSFPVNTLLAALAVLAITLVWALRKPLLASLAAPRLSRSRAFYGLAGLALTAACCMALVGQESPRGLGGNNYQRELAGNGPYQFFAAFRNNELDYRQFYATLPDADISPLLRQEVAEPGARFTGADPLNVRRHIDNPGQPRRLNIVLVTVESLSAKYLGSFGNTQGLTPNLDALRPQSLVFSNFYATGTRTDRGLEAVTLSIPPTPGRSIVKRIGRESGYASLGQQLDAQGYDSVFVYGGRGYFDNMNRFFSGNGYRIVDQASVPGLDIHFQNAWGMADEDAFRQVIKVADADQAKGRPFFVHLMTTSNHRPYTYPDGRIDIPSGNGRNGAVKYTDYAIGRFLAEARQKPWFANTLFVFLADHCAGSAGIQDLPVENYHIPLFIYAPGQVRPGDISKVTSQIDLAPTLMGLLNLDYESTFFGRNALLEDALPGRALIGNYQHLGLFDGRDLAILSPQRGMRRHGDALGASREISAGPSDPLLRRAIAYYQGAGYAFQKRLIAWRPASQIESRLSNR